MSEILTLTAQTRDVSGKGPARTLRRAGRIPAIIYGKNSQEIRISTDLKELTTQYEKGHFTSKVMDISIDGNVIRVLPRDVQLDPVSDVPLHVDFLRINQGEQVSVMVGVRFINAEKSPGLKRGGVLNIVRRDIELICDVDKIPEKIVIDLGELQIGDTVHISHVALPQGTSPAIKNRDFTIATVVGRTESTEDETKTADAAATPAATTAAAPAAGTPGGAKKGK